MHPQAETAQAITEAGGDYVFTVKANQPKLYAACKNLPWSQVKSQAWVQVGHGLRAHRAIKVLTAPGMDHVRRRAADRADPPHHDPGREEKHRGHLRDHLRRLPGRTTIPRWPTGSRATGVCRTAPTGYRT